MKVCAQCGLTSEQDPKMSWHGHQLIKGGSHTVWCWPCATKRRACPCYSDAERVKAGTVAQVVMPKPAEQRSLFDGLEGAA